MSYFWYVAGAYAVFAAFLVWDYAVPRLRLANARRAIVRRGARDAARAGHAAAVPAADTTARATPDDGSTA